MVADTLLEDIVTNKIAPGQRLIAKEIAAQLDVSDIPVREALKMLEATGLIEIQPHIGAVVITPSPEWIEETYVLRAALESMATRTSIEFFSQTDIDELLVLDQEMKLCMKKSDYVEYANLNRKFHNQLISKSPYTTLLSMIDDILVKCQYGRAIFGLKPMSMYVSDIEHDKLLEAIQRRDIESAEKIVRDHRLRIGKELAEIIRTMQKNKPNPLQKEIQSIS
jgi:DNA-binding GntR family transcriptional regulator